MAWLSRVALVAPLLLAAGHAFHPDSPESLAWRLWEDLMEVPKDPLGIGLGVKDEMLWIRGNWLVVWLVVSSMLLFSTIPGDDCQELTLAEVF